MCYAPWMKEIKLETRKEGGNMSNADEKNKYFGEWNFEDMVARIDEFKLGTKIRSETGDVYNLNQAEGEGKQRKFSRWNGTRLRFMTYENIGKKFEIIEEEPEIDVQSLEEIDERYPGEPPEVKAVPFIRINELIRAIKQLDKQIKEK